LIGVGIEIFPMKLGLAHYKPNTPINNTAWPANSLSKPECAINQIAQAG
jgi:hypothetical protein